MSKLSQLVFASSNLGKYKEIQQSLSPFVDNIILQSELKISDIPETGLSFIENALIKARHAAAKSNLPTIADDSGLIVDALQGAPGIYSARYAGENCNFKDNINKLIKEMSNVADNNRQAHFYCVIVYLEHATDPLPKIFTGSLHGSILKEPIGDNGFGYDPIFFVPKYKCSAAELEPNVKNAISHRGAAVEKLIDFFNQK